MVFNQDTLKVIQNELIMKRKISFNPYFRSESDKWKDNYLPLCLILKQSIKEWFWTQIPHINISC